MNSSNIDYRPESGDTTLRDYLRVLFRHKMVILTAVLTVCTTVFIGLQLQTNVYESSVKMLIAADKQVEAPYYRQMNGARDIQQTLTQSEIVKSNPVLGRVVSALALDKRPLDDEKKFCSPLKGILIDYRAKALNKKLENIDEEQKNTFLFNRAILSLKQNIKVEPIRDTSMFTISVKDYNPVGAAIIANVVSRLYVIFDLEQQLAELKLKYGEKHPTVNLIKDSIEKLKKTLSGAPMEDVEAIGPASVKIMEQAVMPIEPAGTPKKLTLLLAVIMSIFLAVMLAFAFEYTDQTVKSPQDIQRFLNLPFLGSIARPDFRNNRLLKDTNNNSKYFQSYQNLSDQICLLFKNKDIKSLLIASPNGQEDTPKLVANLGYYLAQRLQHKVLIIDANLRNSSMSRLLELTNGSGLASFLEGKASLEEIIQNSGTGPDVIRAGNTELNPAILLESSRMKELLAEVAGKYEIVLLDCANLKDFNDAVVLCFLVDAIALTVNEGQTRRQVVQNICSQLQQNKTKIKGVILNNRTFPIPGFLYNSI
ncbi:MAG: polysaccharide biosynthesis tyrosine autokinase [Candidatus Omnitrophica bacterium]|nr:polysaccharide biosynthesis tyrosine autokinase [Candidatus Omnitrophota bacterium]MBU4478894.1 polysaccharide biosynthesis tyrosine autokinase [Candidatus Omnitrophota bacterium]MCG2702952.1 polysaccharide biosynthesis tyrosine autokinase [Candidatus Omnitrophota bacterium]